VIRKILLLNVLFLVLVVNDAFAYTWEYVTHGGYDAAVEAWKRVSLLFSHSGFVGMFLVGFTLGLLFVIVSTLLRAVFGINVTLHAFLPYLVIAGLVYLTLILPKDEIVIYDETLNRGPYTINGIPRFFAFTASLINKAERATIEVVAQSSDPVQDYRYDPAGVAFLALGSSNPKQIDDYKFRTIFRYFEDCIVPSAEMGTYLNWEDLTSGRLSFEQAVIAANNPSLFTVVYNSDGSEQTLSCEEASSIVRGHLVSESTFTTAIKAACARAGYDPDSTASLQQCKDLMSRAFAYLATRAEIPSVPSDVLFPYQQMLFASITEDYVLTHGPEAVGSYLATQKTTGSFIGLGIHANSWIPELKEALSAIVIAVSPILILFTVTPLGFRAFSIMLGMLLWVAVWGVIDAVVFSFGLSMASATAKYLGTPANQGFGLFAATLLPNATAKIYAIFGALRWAGLTLASVITVMLVRFGGTALALLAGQISATPQSAGIEAGQTLTSSPATYTVETLSGMQAWSNVAAAEGLTNLTRGLSMMRGAELAATAEVGRRYSFGSLKEAYEAQKRMDVLSGHAKRGVLSAYSEDSIIKEKLSTEGGRIASFEEFASRVSQTSWGSSLSERDFQYLWNVSGGNFGKAVQLAGLTHFLSKYGEDVIGKEEYDEFKKKGFASQVALLQKYLDTGALSLQARDEGGYVITLTSGKSWMTAITNETFDDFIVQRVNFAGLNSVSYSISDKITERWAAKNGTEAVKSWESFYRSSKETFESREVKRIYEDKFTKELANELADLAKRNEKVREYLKKEGIDEKSFFASLRASLSLGLRKVISVGGTGEIGMEYIRKILKSQGIEVDKSLEKHLEDRVKLAKVNALIETKAEIESRGYTLKDVMGEGFENEARTIEGFFKELDFVKQQSTDASVNLQNELLKWYAEKNNKSEIESFYELDKIFSNPQEAEKMVQSFFNEKEYLREGKERIIQKEREVETGLQKPQIPKEFNRGEVGQTIQEKKEQPMFLSSLKPVNKLPSSSEEQYVNLLE